MKVALGFLILHTCVLAAARQEASPREVLLADADHRRLSARFKEPAVLPTTGTGTEVYRLTVRPTFLKPVSIRIETRGARHVVVAKRLSGAGGYNPGRLQRETRRTLKREEWGQLLALLEAASFWTLPYDDPLAKPDAQGNERICLDGSRWTVEGVRRGQYHAVNRYCSEVQSFDALVYFIASVSGLGLKPADL